MYEQIDVPDMINAWNAGDHRRKLPRVVEIIGPAGAGKTTLYKALNNYPEQIRLGGFPKVHKAEDAPFFIRYGLQLVPSLFRLYRRTSRQLSQREFAWLSILNGWPFVLQREVEKNSQVIVLDQGPVYLLTEMREFGPEYLKRTEAEKLWQKLYCRWAATLDVIVWLDAADIYLLERIRTREQGHVVKNEASPVILEFLERYRRAYEFTLSKLETNASGPRLLRFDTGRQQPAEIVDRLLAKFGCTNESDNRRSGERPPLSTSFTGATRQSSTAVPPF
jgi:hypothetical protein